MYTRTLGVSGGGFPCISDRRDEIVAVSYFPVLARAVCIELLLRGLSADSKRSIRLHISLFYSRSRSYDAFCPLFSPPSLL